MITVTQEPLQVKELQITTVCWKRLRKLFGGGKCYCSLTALKIKFTGSKPRTIEKNSRLLRKI